MEVLITVNKGKGTSNTTSLLVLIKQHVSDYWEAIVRLTVLRDSLRTLNLMMAPEQAETCRFINTNKLVVFDIPFPLLIVTYTTGMPQLSSYYCFVE